MVIFGKLTVIGLIKSVTKLGFQPTFFLTEFYQRLICLLEKRGQNSITVTSFNRKFQLLLSFGKNFDMRQLVMDLISALLCIVNYEIGRVDPMKLCELRML